MGLSAGRLNQRISIDEPNLIDNGRGGQTMGPGGLWRTVATVWAEVVALRGGEALIHSVQRSTQLWRVTIRIRRDITPKHRLRWGLIEMNVRTAAPNEERDGLVITAESGVNI